MAEVLLFHHALGRTTGVMAFADELSSAGHTVVVPDLYDGATFDSIEAGVAHAKQVGFGALLERGVAAAETFGDQLVVAGFSLGALPAQKLAQTRDGVTGAILFHAAVPAAEFGTHWPADVALQVHMTEHDPWAEEDLDAARALATEAGGELFLYPGSGHLIADSSYGDYEPDQAGLVMERTLAFLD